MEKSLFHPFLNLATFQPWWRTGSMVFHVTLTKLKWIIGVWFTISVITQLLLIIWRKRHRRSYQFFTNCLLWALPPITLLLFNQTRLPTIWIIFSLFSVTTCLGTILRPAASGPLIFTWFRCIHLLSMFFVRLSVIIWFCDFIDIRLLFNGTSLQWRHCSLTLISYGVYFGILGRDLGKILIDHIFAMVSTDSGAALPVQTPDTNRCPICNVSFPADRYKRPVWVMQAVHVNANECRQFFHENCLYGQIFIGKTLLCVSCQITIDPDATFMTMSWEVFHGQFLDALRYAVLWFPMAGYIVGVICLSQFIVIE